MLKLYYLQGVSSFVPHVALHWTKAEFEAIHLARGDHKKPEFLAMNPMGAVPLLTDGDWALTQNIAILDYLNDVYPHAHIFGNGDAQQKAKARQWLALANTDLHGKMSQIFHITTLLSDKNAQNEAREKAIVAIKKIYAQADNALSQNDYLTGNHITIADVYFYITQRWARKIDLDLHEFAHLTAHFARVEQNAGVQAALKSEDLL